MDRKSLTIVFIALAVLTLVAFLLTPPATKDGKIPLVWTTDANPQRDAQVDKFNEMYPDCHLKIDPDNSNVMKNIVQCSSGMGRR